MSLDKLLDTMAEDLANKVVEKALPRMEARLFALIKNYEKMPYTEKEAADFLGMGKDKLAELRIAGAIRYSQTVGVPGKRNGRFIYLRNHLLDYARRHQIEIVSKELVTLDDVLGSNVVSINSFKEAA